MWCERWCGCSGNLREGQPEIEERLVELVEVDEPAAIAVVHGKRLPGQHGLRDGVASLMSVSAGQLAPEGRRRAGSRGGIRQAQAGRLGIHQAGPIHRAGRQGDSPTWRQRDILAARDSPMGQHRGSSTVEDSQKALKEQRQGSPMGQDSLLE